MNEILKAIKERRSIRKFKPDAIPMEAIDQIIEAGIWAPSAGGKQNVITVAVMNKTLRDRLSEMNRKIGGWDEGFDPFYGAPVVLIVLGDKNWPNRVYDGSLVMGNMMLAAHSIGIGSRWIHRALQEFDSEEGKQILKELDIEGEYEGIGHCILGYIEGDVPEPQPRKANRVYYAK